MCFRLGSTADGNHSAVVTICDLLRIRHTCELRLVFTRPPSCVPFSLATPTGDGTEERHAVGGIGCLGRPQRIVDWKSVFIRQGFRLVRGCRQG